MSTEEFTPVEGIGGNGGVDEVVEDDSVETENDEHITEGQNNISQNVQHENTVTVEGHIPQSQSGSRVSDSSKMSEILTLLSGLTADERQGLDRMNRASGGTLLPTSSSSNAQDTCQEV